MSEIGLWALVAVVIIAGISGWEDMRRGELPHTLLGCFLGWVVACHAATGLAGMSSEEDENESEL